MATPSWIFDSAKKSYDVIELHFHANGQGDVSPLSVTVSLKDAEKMREAIAAALR